MVLAGETEESTGLEQGLAGLSFEAGNDWIHEGAWCALLILPYGAGRKATEHLRFRLG
jgi:hypothetical protein